ncbi:MAG: transporter substrate-binding domain-containing protein [Bacteroidota bacterium]
MINKTKDMKFRLVILMLVFTAVNVYSENSDTITVGYKVSPPFVIKQDSILTGPSVWLWEKVVEENDITYKYVELSLDNLLKGIANGSVDVSLSPLTITSERSGEIDFTSPYYIAHSSILQKNISTKRKTLDFIKAFFSLAFFRALGALVIVILIFGFLVWIFERRTNKTEFDNGLKGLWSGFWWSAVTMTTVGYGDKSPQTVVGRMIALIWMFTAIIIISGLTASIASALTLYQIDSVNNAIEDFKRKKIGTIGESGTDEWLKTNFYTNKKTFTGIAELLNALDENRIEAVAYDRPILQSVINSDSLAKYKLLNIDFYPQFYAMGMNRDLSKSLKHDINLSILSNTEKMDWKVLLSENDLNY